MFCTIALVIWSTPNMFFFKMMSYWIWQWGTLRVLCVGTLAENLLCKMEHVCNGTHGVHRLHYHGLRTAWDCLSSCVFMIFHAILLGTWNLWEPFKRKCTLYRLYICILHLPFYHILSISSVATYQSIWIYLLVGVSNMFFTFNPKNWMITPTDEKNMFRWIETIRA